MKKLAAALVLVAFCAAAFAAEAKPKKEKPEVEKSQGQRNGLVAHYYRDPANWEGNWNAGSKPTGDPEDYTFTSYSHSRVEPLVNHLFIRRGWFSVRWTGVITIPGDGAAVAVTFEIWADDGCRLFIDDEKVIDDWRAVDEEATDSHRTKTLNLTPGTHEIVIEYFQGESLRHDDKDPAKLYWKIPAKNIPKQIVPASALSYTQDDLFPQAGRLDPQGDEFIEQLVERLRNSQGNSGGNQGNSGRGGGGGRGGRGGNNDEE